MLTDHIHDSIGKHRMGIIADLMPEFVKVAEDKIVTEDLSTLPNGCFAHCEGTERYFPIHSPEHVWLSRAYFEKCANSLDENLRKNIDSRIADAEKAFAVTGINNAEFAKEAATEDDIDYLQRLADDINQFISNYKTLEIKERRRIAKELKQRATALGRRSGLPQLVSKYSGNKLVKNYEQAFMDRIGHFREGAPERVVIMNLQGMAPSSIPEFIAEALAKFDHKYNLHQKYDQTLVDPYYSLLEDGEVDEDPIFSHGHHCIYPHELKKFDFNGLDELFDTHVIDNLKTDFANTIKSFDPHVRMVIIKKIKGM